MACGAGGVELQEVRGSAPSGETEPEREPERAATDTERPHPPHSMQWVRALCIFISPRRACVQRGLL